MSSRDAGEPSSASSDASPVRRSTRFVVTKTGEIKSSLGRTPTFVKPWMVMTGVSLTALSIYAFTLYRLGGNLNEDLEREAKRIGSDRERQKKRDDASLRPKSL